MESNFSGSSVASGVRPVAPSGGVTPADGKPDRHCPSPLRTGRGKRDNGEPPRPSLLTAVSPVALGKREWPAGGISPVMTTGPSAPKDGWLLPESKPKYHLPVPQSTERPTVVRHRLNHSGYRAVGDRSALTQRRRRLLSGRSGRRLRRPAGAGTAASRLAGAWRSRKPPAYRPCPRRTRSLRGCVPCVAGRQACHSRCGARRGAGPRPSLAATRGTELALGRQARCLALPSFSYFPRHMVAASAAGSSPFRPSPGLPPFSLAPPSSLPLSTSPLP
jgi:hypothetical protein